MRVDSSLRELKLSLCKIHLCLSLQSETTARHRGLQGKKSGDSGFGCIFTAQPLIFGLRLHNGYQFRRLVGCGLLVGFTTLVSVSVSGPCLLLCGRLDDLSVFATRANGNTESDLRPSRCIRRCPLMRTGVTLILLILWECGYDFGSHLSKAQTSRCCPGGGFRFDAERR